MRHAPVCPLHFKFYLLKRDTERLLKSKYNKRQSLKQLELLLYMFY